MAPNRAKMSPHSRAALEAADTIKNVISSFNDTPFMSEATDDRTARRKEVLATAAPDIQDAMVRGLPAYLAEKLVKLDGA